VTELSGRVDCQSQVLASAGRSRRQITENGNAPYGQADRTAWCRSMCRYSLKYWHRHWSKRVVRSVMAGNDEITTFWSQPGGAKLDDAPTLAKPKAW
jgi:hypothetical protein